MLLGFNFLNMKVSFLIFCFFVSFLLGISFAAEGADLSNSKYQRKSIASTDRIVVLSDQYDLIDSSQVKSILDPYIALSRFDRNELPVSLSRLFLEAVYATANHTIESLGVLVKEFYADEIQSLLSNPDIQKARINQFKEKNEYTFEFGKGKSYSVTDQDLETLFSSAFFYIPYIRDTRYGKEFFIKKIDDTEKKMKRISVSVDAGIIWYQIKVLPNQELKVDLVEQLGARSYHTHDESVYGNDVDIINRLLLDCLKEIGNEFSYKIKNMSVFNLHGHINSASNNSLLISLNANDGVLVDDYFWIMEDYQSDHGYQSKQVGLTFVSHFVNDHGTLPLSKATQIFGDKYHVGSWVKESPRYGVSLQLNLGYMSGFQLDSRDSYVSSRSFFSNDVSSVLGMDFSLSYLLSKSFLKSYLVSNSDTYNPFLSQLFFDINVGVAPVSMDYGELVHSSDLRWNVLSGIYVGLRKLFWLNHVAYQPFVYIGNNGFSMTQGSLFSFGDDDDSDDTVFQLNQSVFKYGVSIEKMISPYVLVNLSLFKCLGLGKGRKTYVLDYDTSYSTKYDDKISFSTFNWYGFSVGFRFFR